MEFVTLIMKNFGAFIPGIRGDNVNVRGLSRPCGHLMCSKRCVPVAGIHWPQVSYSKVSNSSTYRLVASLSINSTNCLLSGVFYLLWPFGEKLTFAIVAWHCWFLEP